MPIKNPPKPKVKVKLPTPAKPTPKSQGEKMGKPTVYLEPRKSNRKTGK